jgi:hypothetical protein
VRFLERFPPNIAEWRNAGRYAAISHIAKPEINFSSGWTPEHETSDWCWGQWVFRRSSETSWKEILHHSVLSQINESAIRDLGHRVGHYECTLGQLR